jgi:hypothetical protein
MIQKGSYIYNAPLGQAKAAPQKLLSNKDARARVATTDAKIHQRLFFKYS